MQRLAMLIVDRVSKRYGPSIALDGVSLTLAPNRTHVLLGSSGSGKSTLLRAILGILPTDEGSVSLHGVEIGSMLPSERATRIGYVPQDGGLFPHLTVERNVTLVARAHGWNRAEASRRLDELVPLVSLDPSFLSRYPSELSGGQKQRVALLRAIFLDPELLLLDEPLGALDPLIRSDLQSELKETFSRLKKTVVFVTHDIGEAHFLGDGVILMQEGRVVQQGSMTDLRDLPATPFVTRFLNAQRGFFAGPV